MQGLVAVGLGPGDVVLEPARHGLPQRVDDAQHRVAVLLGVDEHAHGDQVVDLLKGEALLLHLLVDGVEVLRAAGDVGLDVRVVEGLAQLVDDVVDGLHPLLAAHGDAVDQVVVALRVQVAEAEVLQLPLDGVDAQADVLGHGEEHLAQGLGLLLVLGAELDAVQLCHAVDQARNVRAEVLLDVVVGGLGVLDAVVQERGDDGGLVHLHVGQDLGHLERVDDIGLPGLARLRAVHLERVVEGRVDGLAVHLRLVGAHLGHERVDLLVEGFLGVFGWRHGNPPLFSPQGPAVLLPRF